MPFKSILDFSADTSLQISGAHRTAQPRSILVDEGRRIPIFGAQSQGPSFLNTDRIRTKLVAQTQPATPKGGEESPIGRGATSVLDAVSGSPGALFIRYNAPKAPPKTEPETESKTDPITERKTDPIDDETLRR